MKSTLQSMWLLTVAGGNLLIVFVVAFDLFPSQSVLFFFFAGLMFLGTVIFMFLGYKYIPTISEEEEEEGEEEDQVSRPSSERRIPRRRQSIAETVATGAK
jgi:hypothetical protein